MITGHVNDALEPMVEIGLSKGDLMTTILAVIDTGFSGYLCLSEQHLDQLALSLKFVERYELANGEVITKDVFQGKIVFDGVEKEIDIILTASQDTLIGASLLEDHQLTIDYPNRIVRIGT